MADRAGGRRLLPASLRARITFGAGLAVAAVLAVSSVVVVTTHRASLDSRLDEQLVQRALEVANVATTGTVPERLLGGPDDDAVTQVVDPAGEVVSSSPNLAGARPIDAAPGAGRATAIRPARFPDVDEAAFRLLTTTVDGPSGPLLVHVGVPVDDVEESSAALAAALAGVVPVAVAALALVIWVVVGRSLAPVEAIRAGVASMDGADLGRRVPEPRYDDEVGRLARTMNAMLGRVEEATERQRRFVADVSHELRSPLTQIRSELEVDVAHPETADPVGTAGRVRGATEAMQRLVDDLLLLARSDAGARHRREDPVDLDVVVLDVVRRHRGGGLPLDTALVGAGQARGDADELARAAGNLVDNAVRHAATAVTLALREDGGRVILTVDDDGPGIPPAERARVFERFVRLDESRARGTGGTGLGLAIAREVATAHGGTLTTVDRPGGPGARFVLDLPALSP